MKLSIKPVETTRDLSRFIRLPWTIYQNDSLWVPPLIHDQKRFLSINKGPYFEHGKAQYWLAFKDNHPVGRIAAHISGQYEQYRDRETGFFGFFESINDQTVAQKLFEHAEQWLEKHGKSRILGPQSFGLYDIAGLLYDGFDTPPPILLAHNPPYYRDLLERCGFRKAIDWYAFLVNKTVRLDPRLWRVRDRILRRPNLSIIPLDPKKIDQAAKDIKPIFANAWKENWGHVPFSEKEFAYMVHELSQVLVPELTYLAYLDGQCIGFSLSIKDVNPALQKANGRLFPVGILKILLHLPKIKKLRTIAMGILKEHRHKGIDIAFYLNTIEKGINMGFTESDCSIIVETNHAMIQALRDLDAQCYKTFRFYEKTTNGRLQD